MDRKTRHDIKHDKFLDQIANAYEVAHENRRALLVGAGILALVVAIVVGVVAWRSASEGDAQRLLSEAIETMSTQPGEESDFETEEERLAVAEEQFREVIAEYGSSDAAEVAELYLGQIAAVRGENAEALESYRRFAEEYEDNILGLVAEWSTYSLRISQGETEQVIAELETQVDDPNARRLPLPSVLAMLARAYEIEGNDEEAMKHWRRITTEFNDSPYALEANRKLVQG